jgi:endogenous inhibitor of DNA gyrase (YacG/DUF329 family)
VKERPIVTVTCKFCNKQQPKYVDPVRGPYQYCNKDCERLEKGRWFREMARLSRSENNRRKE